MLSWGGARLIDLEAIRGAGRLYLPTNETARRKYDDFRRAFTQTDSTLELVISKPEISAFEIHTTAH